MRVTAAIVLLLLAGCPALQSPLGAVSGRIVGASEGAYAYPFGRPDLKVATAADGTWRIDGVPTSVPALVLYDGAKRAELVPVALRGGDENRVPDRFGEAAPVDEALRMPVAAALIAAAIPDGGALATGASYTVVGTDVADRVQGAGEPATLLGPLPAGRFEVRSTLAGFVGGAAAVDAVSGATVSLAIPLLVDDREEEPGCAAAVGCANELHCDSSDGRCYECADASDCAVGELCGGGLCEPTAGPAAWTCAACADDAGCDAAAGLACVVAADEATGYCAPACATAADCPAGFDCAGARCVAPDGCDDWLQTMGAPCVDAAQCSDLHLGTCTAPAGASGYCTAPCGADADCRIGTGTAATMTCTAGLCALP